MKPAQIYYSEKQFKLLNLILKENLFVWTNMYFIYALQQHLSVPFKSPITLWFITLWCKLGFMTFVPSCWLTFVLILLTLVRILTFEEPFYVQSSLNLFSLFKWPLVKNSFPLIWVESCSIGMVIMLILFSYGTENKTV